MIAPLHRVALAESVTRDDVDDAAHALGLQLTNVLPSSAERPGQLVFASRDARTVVHLVDDVRLSISYFAASGADAEGELARIGERLACDGLEVGEALVADMSDLPRFRRGIGLTALLSSAESAEVVDLFDRAFAHGDVRVRAVALTAASYLDWRAMVPLLERLRSDEAPAIRDAAARVLAVRGARQEDA